MKIWLSLIACVTFALFGQGVAAQESEAAAGSLFTGVYSKVEIIDGKKVCKIGKPCGDTCINVNYTCRLNTPPSPTKPTSPSVPPVPAEPSGTSTQADGMYGGIYQSPLSDSSWVSVHHNEVRIVAAQFESQLQFNGAITGSLGRVTPPVLSTWSLLGGTFSGNKGTLSGELEYGACNITVTAVFSDTSFSLTPVSATQTDLGKASGYNCGAYITELPWPLVYKRIF